MNVSPTSVPPSGLCGVRTLQHAGPVDIVLDGAHVADVLPHDPAHLTDSTWLDLRGYTVLPAAADPHAHLDKSRSWDLVNPPVGDLPGAVAAWSDAASGFTEDDILDRARGTAMSMLAAGTTAVRTHVDVYGGTGADPWRGIRALDRLRTEMDGMMTLQIVALVPAHTPDARLAELAGGALDAGADLVGGAPHLADDPLTQTDALIDIAEAHDVGCDLHIDEFITDRTRTIHRYADRVAGWDAGRDRVAGHCCRLSRMDGGELDATATELVDAAIPVIGLPATNLYLQDGQSRAIAPLTGLRERGVQVAAGGDNVADPFNPTGRADALETAALLVTAAHQHPDEALELVTTDARAVMGLAAAGPVPGAVADLLCIRAPDTPGAPPPPPPSAATLIAAAPPDRTVLAGGRVVAHTESTTTFATASTTTPRRTP
ncbi:MAG: amidohydrolase family protein [Corynebacterium sp.]|uniref:amidohydrolase family protein n=1 Tax=Corynebacterium sp. TaxID=1720 RepID=UPI003F99BF08